MSVVPVAEELIVELTTCHVVHELQRWIYSIQNLERLSSVYCPEPPFGVHVIVTVVLPSHEAEVSVGGVPPPEPPEPPELAKVTSSVFDQAEYIIPLEL